jgi:hypothetical protein
MRVHYIQYTVYFLWCQGKIQSKKYEGNSTVFIEQVRIELTEYHVRVTKVQAGPNGTTISPSLVCLLLEDGQRRRMSLDPAYPWLLSGTTPEEMKHVPIITSIYIESRKV